MEPWLRGDYSVLCLSRMEKPDELSHLIKGFPLESHSTSWCAKFNYWNQSVSHCQLLPWTCLPIVQFPLLWMDLYQLTHVHTPAHGIRMLGDCELLLAITTQHCCYWSSVAWWACDQYPGGDKLKLILPSQPFWNSRTSHGLLSSNTKCKAREQLQYAVIRSVNLLWNYVWGFECFSLCCFLMIRE